MTQGTYERAFGRSVRLNGIFALLKGSSADQIAFSKKLKSDGWLTISSTAEHWQNYEANFAIINSVVVLVTFMAACLSFVVVFTLSNTNISERERELATIKVLGFYDQEVYRYIFREIELLALIGSGVGLALGVPLHKFIVLTVEMDQLMFIRTIAPRSYLLAVALTMVFTVVVCFVMRRHVRRISMVESMKAPE